MFSHVSFYSARLPNRCGRDGYRVTPPTPVRLVVAHHVARSLAHPKDLSLVLDFVAERILRLVNTSFQQLGGVMKADTYIWLCTETDTESDAFSDVPLDDDGILFKVEQRHGILSERDVQLTRDDVFKTLTSDLLVVHERQMLFDKAIRELPEEILKMQSLTLKFLVLIGAIRGFLVLCFEVVGGFQQTLLQVDYPYGLHNTARHTHKFAVVVGSADVLDPTIGLDANHAVLVLASLNGP